MKKFALGAVICICSLALLAAALSYRPVPERIDYGVTFSKFFADELGVDWIDVFQAALDDLKIRKFRLVAYWPLIEPKRDVYDFADLDYQIAEAAARDAEVVLAIGRRLPRWPECHTPTWVGTMPWEEQKMELRQYLTAVVERYKDEPAITMWQVENEPYLHAYAGHICGELDEEFLKEEVALVKNLDPSRPVLVTDSGNLGTWYKPYSVGDAFGTSVYVHFWTPELGQFRTVQPAALYRLKTNLMRVWGDKPSVLIELSGEPWLVEPVTKVPIETQLTRMNLEKFRDIVSYAEATHFSEQYFWGVEWWYWMRERGHAEFWDYARTLYAK